MQIALLRCGVAADIDDAARLEGDRGLEELGRGAGARRVDGEHVDAFVVGGGVEHVIGGVVGHKPRAAAQVVELGVLARIGHACGVALHAEQHDLVARGRRLLGCAKADGSAAAVGVHDHVTASELHAVDGDLVEELGLFGVRLVERGGRDTETAAEQLVAQ